MFKQLRICWHFEVNDQQWSLEHILGFEGILYSEHFCRLKLHLFIRLSESENRTRSSWSEIPGFVWFYIAFVYVLLILSSKDFEIVICGRIRLKNPAQIWQIENLNKRKRIFCFIMHKSCGYFYDFHSDESDRFGCKYFFYIGSLLFEFLWCFWQEAETILV